MCNLHCVLSSRKTVLHLSFFIFVELTVVHVQIACIEAASMLAAEVQKAVKIPVIVGSGVTTDNLSQYMSANAMIVGSYFKLHGQWFNEIDPPKVQSFMNNVIKHRDEATEMTQRQQRQGTFDLTAQGE